MGRKDGNCTSGGGGFRNHNNVPVKDCVTCGRPFTWRKKWEKCWDEVLTCSERCKGQRRSKGKQDGRGAGIAAAIAAAGAGCKNGAKCEESSGSDNYVGRAAVEYTEGAPAESLPHATCEESSNRTDDAHVGKATITESEIEALRHVWFTTEAPFRGMEPEMESCDNFESLTEDIVHESDSEHTSCAETSNVPVSPRTARRAHKQAVKAAKRAQRSGSPGAVASKQKLCDDCSRPVDLLIRCTSDSSQQWNMLCGRCWKSASGGVPDGDADHPHYRYGGLWKNRAACASTPHFTGHQPKAVAVS